MGIVILRKNNSKNNNNIIQIINKLSLAVIIYLLNNINLNKFHANHNQIIQ